MIDVVFFDFDEKIIPVLITKLLKTKNMEVFENNSNKKTNSRHFINSRRDFKQIYDKDTPEFLD